MGACGLSRPRFTSVLVAMLPVAVVLAAALPGVAGAEPAVAPARAQAVCEGPVVATMLDAAEQQEMLDLHNALRARYGSPPLTWDATLASCAQDWADQRAAGEQQAHRSPNPFGENVFGNWSCCAPAPFVSTPADAMGFWGGEEPDYDVATNECVAGTVCGHFTQVVWSTTARLGCGKALTPDSPEPGATSGHWVCNYDPPGNDGGRPFDPAAVPPTAEPPVVVPPAEPPTAEPPVEEPPAAPPAEEPPTAEPPPEEPPAGQEGGDTPAGEQPAGDGEAPPGG